MVDGSRRSPIRPAERSFTLRCARPLRRPRIMSSEKPIVHVIDDDEAVREVLAFQLGSAGIEVRTYDSAAAFLKIVPTVQAGCIITDVRMPDLSGIDLLRRLRELQVAVPVIVITAHGDIPLAVEAMRIGAVDFLEKPFADEVLLASVRSALEKGDRDRKRESERSSIQSRLAGLSNRAYKAQKEDEKLPTKLPTALKSGSVKSE